MQYLLAIETSCDETAAAVIDRDRRVLSSVVSTQTALHEHYGGVVPEIASRAHLERILPVIDEAIQQAGLTLQDMSAIAVATHPGLSGSLLIGLTAAKTLCLATGLPLIAVDHILAHIYACQMTSGRDVYPCVGFVVSGGHTHLFDCPSPLDHKLLGCTIDDAAGEAFDKVAQILGLGYPGGPLIQKIAEQGNPKACAFPRIFIRDERLDFSFSGLKTAVLYEYQGIPGQPPKAGQGDPQRIADVAASFQAAVVDILVAKADAALKKTGYRRLCVGGGVAANGPFREALSELSARRKADVIVAPMEYCTDNAAMGAIGWELFEAERFASLDTDITPGLVRR